ncbi:hypothetical protein MPOCJGCO_3539 [Methylobacterium trifolii]|uniref:Uncharacterized protein n=1 Tax=Methylobacterium trifolii TaxID=1003092 RepID=A0ABQ4U4V0_9HYPH|nr:hypothetical protein MPOCJGCO_3539 [Methylobacterium trifolii]
MPAKHVRRIALTETLAPRIDRPAARGAHASASGPIRTAIRMPRMEDPGRVAVRPASPMARPVPGLNR